jgi:hypothetical protein
MKINGLETTSISKVNGIPLASIGKMSGVTFVPPSPIPFGIVTNNLIMYLDSAVSLSYSGAGTNWEDITYNGNNGTLVNNPTYSSANGGSILFDGVNDYVSLTNVNLNIANLQDWAWNVWIKTPSVLSGYKMILSTAQNYIYLALFNNQFAFDTRVSTQVRFGTLLPNTWYNATVVRKSGVNYRYVNGVLINSNTDSFVPTGTFNVGRWAFNNSLYYNSNMSVISMYNASLTATEVLQNYNAIYSRYLPSTLSILNADASTYNSSLPTTWTDLNGHIGSLVNGTSYSPTFGGNMVFDGIDDYATFPNELALNSQTFTMESWVSLNTLAQEGFIFEKGEVNTQYSNFFYTDGNYYFRTMGLSNQDLSIPSASYLTERDWYHLVCTYGGGVKTIYVNGVIATQVSGVTGTVPYNNSGLFLGCYYIGGGTSFNLNGNIAISRAYNLALTQSQIQQNFNAEKTRFGY